MTYFRVFISVMCFKKFKEDSVQIPSQKNWIPSFCPNSPYMCPDAHQCLEDSNCSSLHPSGRYSKFEKNPAFKVHPSGRRGNTVRTPVSVRQVNGFPSQAHIWEDSCNRSDERSTPSGRYP
jgi:hypothetical protein